jgi:hypothetical protein
MLMPMESAWLILIISLPTHNSTGRRMRVWRALKALGCGALRDGVYLLPDRPALRAALQAQADDVIRGGGTAYVLLMPTQETKQQALFQALFDRSAEYADLMVSLQELPIDTAARPITLQKALMRLRKAFETLVAVDFFPTPAREQAAAALDDKEHALREHLSPDEPHAVARRLTRLDRSDYRNRLWATRRRPWIDRLASAWLISRCIDPQARFLWLAATADCPGEAVGFDFDGAPFTHVGARVTFETLLASFGLVNDRALVRLGSVVHYLDVGGIPVEDAAGIDTLIKGMHLRIPDDEVLLHEASSLFDSLYSAYSNNDP